MEISVKELSLTHVELAPEPTKLTCGFIITIKSMTCQILSLNTSARDGTIMSLIRINGKKLLNNDCIIISKMIQ